MVTSFSRNLARWCPAVGLLFLLAGCGGNPRPSESLFGPQEPRAAAWITAFLDRHHEPYLLETEGRMVIIRVASDRVNPLKEYLSGPMDSTRVIQLVKGCRLAEKDSARVHRELAEAVKKKTFLREDHPDTLRIGAAFETVFEQGTWAVKRTREYEIIVEYSGRVKNRAIDAPSGAQIMGALTDHRDYLIAEVGTAGAQWNFRWRVGIDQKSFVKESTRVTLGGDREGKKEKAGEVLHIDL